MKILPVTPPGRLAVDARAHAKRIGIKRYSGGWYAFGIQCLKQGLLIKRTVRGIVRYLPPPLDPFPKAERGRMAKIKHARHRS
jgi:hypothetical protein